MMNEIDFTFTGIFIPEEEIREKLDLPFRRKLSVVTADPHVTLEYQPDDPHTELFGKRVKVIAIAYGSSVRNEGVKVVIDTDSPLIAKMAGRLEAPHITLSISEDGLAVDTRYLRFRPIRPVELSGVFGGRTNDKRVILSQP